MCCSVKKKEQEDDGMKSLLKKLLAAVCALCTAGCFDVMDGDGMIRSWKHYDLMNISWIEITDEEKAGTMKFSESEMSYEDVLSASGTSAYRTEDSGDEDEHYIALTDTNLFERLILHYETIDGQTVPILSGTIMELDGRGEIIIMEFIPDKFKDMVDGDYQSELCRMKNDRKPVPSYIASAEVRVKRTETAEPMDKEEKPEEHVTEEVFRVREGDEVMGISITMVWEGEMEFMMPGNYVCQDASGSEFTVHTGETMRLECTDVLDGSLTYEIEVLDMD